MIRHIYRVSNGKKKFRCKQRVRLRITLFKIFEIESSGFLVFDKRRWSSSYSDRKFILSMQRYRNQRYKVTNKVYVLRVYERYIYSLRVRTNVFGGNRCKEFTGIIQGIWGYNWDCWVERIMYIVSLSLLFRVRTYYARLIYSGVGRPREDPTARSSPLQDPAAWSQAESTQLDSFLTNQLARVRSVEEISRSPLLAESILRSRQIISSDKHFSFFF